MYIFLEVWNFEEDCPLPILSLGRGLAGATFGRGMPTA